MSDNRTTDVTWPLISPRPSGSPTFQDVMDCWKTRSLVAPLRDDGKPNRPLTAYSIEPVEIPGP